MTILVIIIPLIGAMLAGLCSNVIGRKGAAIITTILMFINVFITMCIFHKILFFRKIYFVKVGTWIYSDSFR